MPNSAQLISKLYSGNPISRIINMTFSTLERRGSIQNIIHVIIVLPGLLITGFMVRFGLANNKTFRKIYLWLYFLGKSISDSQNIALIKRFIHPGATVLDIGSAFGFYSFVSSKLASTDGKIMSFEPDPMSRLFLSDLVEKKHLSNVEVYPFAIWNDNVELDLNICQENPGENSLIKQSLHNKSITVPAISIDEHFNLTTVDFVKIDVQGGEYYVIKGMENVIRRSPNIVLIIECTPVYLKSAGVKVKDLLALLSDLNLKIFRCDSDPPTEVFTAGDLDHLNNVKMGYCDLICFNKRHKNKPSFLSKYSKTK